MMMTRCQDHILTENIWFVWSETSYSGDKWRCHRCGTDDKQGKIVLLSQWTVGRLSLAIYIEYSQSGQDQKNCQVDHDNHVNVSLVVDLADVADGEENDGGDEDGEDVTDQRPPKADVHFNTLIISDRRSTHNATFHHILCQIRWTRVS